MGRKKELNLLLCVTLFILSGCQVASTEKCPRNTTDPAVYCKGAYDTMDNTEGCSPSLKQAACADNYYYGVDKLVDDLQCFAFDKKSIADKEGFIVLFNEIPLSTLDAALELFGNQIPGINDISMEGKAVVMRGLWDRLETEDMFMSDDFLKTWFQTKLSPLLPAVPKEILNCMTLYPLSCNGMGLVVQALDNVYSSMEDAEKSVVAAWITKSLTLNGCTKKSSKVWLSTYWKNFSKNAKYSDFVSIWSGFDGYMVSDVLTAKQLAELTAKTDALKNTAKTRNIINILNNNNIAYLDEYMDDFAQYSEQMKLELDANLSHMMLTAVVSRLNSSYPDGCTSSLGNWFQGKLPPLMFAADAQILKQLPNPNTCKDFQAIYKGIDASSSLNSTEFQKAVFYAKLKFLNAQQKKEGSACTYPSSGTSDWLQANFGPSSLFASYADFKRLNPNFDPIQVVNDLTPVQLADATIDLNILGAASTPEDSVIAEMKMKAIMESLQIRLYSDFEEYLMEFLMLASEENIESIQNANVRDIMWDTIFDKITEKTDSFLTKDWENWFQSQLTLFTPSIKADQLMDIPTSNDCSHFQAILLGLDEVYNQMTIKTKQDVTEWIFNFLKNTSCDDSNWLTVNWRSFSQNANLRDIITVNPDFDGFKHLDQLTATQLADLMVISGALSNVTETDAIFKKLEHVPGNTDLAAYWDSLNSIIEQSNEIVDITKEVKDDMLTNTMRQLRTDINKFTSQDYETWMQDRLLSVLDSINSTTLKYVPLNIACESHKALIGGINEVYLELPESNKLDVAHFIVSTLEKKYKGKKPSVESYCSRNLTFYDWLTEIFGNFSKQVTFSQLNVYRVGSGDAYEILPLLTPEQIGDMILMSDTLESITLTNKLYDFFDERPVSELRACMVQFTERAREEQITKLPQPQVTKLMLKRHMNIISVETNTYNATTWEAVFDKELFFLISAFDEATLQYIVVTDCDQLIAIVRGLNTGYDDMSILSTLNVVAWITSSLSRTQGCIQVPAEEWPNLIWGKFINTARLTNLEKINPDFNPGLIIDVLTVPRLSEYTVISDALTNVTEIERIIEEVLNGDDSTLSNIDLYLSLLYRYAARHNITAIQNIPVRDTMMSIFFPYVITNLDTMTEDDQNVWFQDTLAWLMPSVGVLNLDQIPLDISCNSFFAICAGFDSAYQQLSDETRMTIYNFIKTYLTNQLTKTGKACTTDITNSRDYLDNIFRSFSALATIPELTFFYKDFNVFDVLPKLTSVQLAEATMQSNILHDSFSVARFLTEMERRSFEEMDIYITRLNEIAEQKNLRTITNSSVRDFMLQTVFKPLQFELPTFDDRKYAEWFQRKLSLLVDSITSDDLDKIPDDIDCLSHEIIIESLNNGFETFSDDQRTAVHQRIKRYLSAERQRTDSACAVNLSTQEWLQKNYGKFSVLASVEELIQLNNGFDGFEVLADFTPEQLADFTVTSRSLENETDFFKIFERIPDITGLGVYLDTLNSEAQDLLKTCTFGTEILNGVISLLSGDFKTFTVDTFVTWFQGRLITLLNHINESIYQEISQATECDSFQAINKAIYSVYDDIGTESLTNIYEVIKQYLLSKFDRKSGAACKGTTVDNRDWLLTNIGRFSVFANYSDFTLLYRNFNGFKVLDLMTTQQLAEFTVESNALNDEEALCQIMYYMENRTASEIYEFLDQFVISTEEAGITVIGNNAVRRKMLLQFTKDLSPQFSDFTLNDWTTFLQRTKLLIPSTDAEIMAFLPPVSCESFQAIVQGLNQAYPFMPQANRNEVYQALLKFLQYKFNLTGSPCTGNTIDSSDWLNKCFGKFSVNAQYADLTEVNPQFNEISLLDSLTMGQLAEVAITYLSENMADSINVVMNAVANGKPKDVYDFIVAFQNFADEKNITFIPEEIRNTISVHIFPKLSSLFLTFNDSQWEDFFQKQLRFFKSSINADALKKIPKQISCTAFQSVVAGLDMEYSDMTLSSKQDVFNMVKQYLSLKKAKVVGTPCPGKDSTDWIQKNFASFKTLAAYSDFTDVDGDFDGINAAGILNPQQLADMCFATNALQNKETILKILANVDLDKLSAFMDQFNWRANQNNLFTLPNTEIRKVILMEVFCRLREVFPTFVFADYKTWFQDKLKLVLAGIDGGALEFLPSNLTCDSFQAIIKGINDMISAEGYTKGAEVYSFARNTLQTQLQSTGSACTDGATGDLEWLEVNFGSLVEFASYSDLVSLKSNFNAFQTLQVFNSVQMSSLAVNSSALHNPEDMGAIFDAIQNSNDISFLASFLDTFNDLMKQKSLNSLNSTVRDVMLTRSLQIISPEFSKLGLTDIEQWLKKLKGFLLSINSIALQLLPTDMSCEIFQAIVKALSCVYSQLTTEQRQNVYDFQIRYLIVQLNDGGSACDENAPGSKDWLQINLGKFCSLAEPSAIAGIYPQFNSTSFTSDCANV